MNEYISQGNSFRIFDDEIELLQTLLNSRGLKYNLENNTCTLSSKIIGIISLPNRRIILTPRHEGISISHAIRMYFFVNNYLSGNNVIDDIYDISGPDKNLDISKVFLSELTRIIKIGLPIDYTCVKENSPYYKGSVDTLKTQQNIYQKRLKPVATRYNVLSHEIDTNHILSGALNKIRLKVPAAEIGYYETHLPYSDPDMAKLLLERTSLNRQHAYCKVAINYATMILLDYSYESINGKCEGEVFLVDYDRLFESFVWAVVRTFSNDNHYARWKKNQVYGEYTNQADVKYKSYIPDLLYGQLRVDPPKYLCVLDVKNKLPKIFSNADIFQIYFYITILEAQSAILIYPATESTSQTTLSFHHPLLKNLKVNAVTLKITASTAKDFQSDLKSFCMELHSSIYS